MRRGRWRRVCTGVRPAHGSRRFVEAVLFDLFAAGELVRKQMKHGGLIPFGTGCAIALAPGWLVFPKVIYIAAGILISFDLMCD